jgi:hypothetical protein
MDVCVMLQFGLAQSIQNLDNEVLLNLYQCAELFGLSGILHCSLGLGAVFHVPCGLCRNVASRAFRSQGSAWCTPYSQRETSHTSFKWHTISICNLLLSCINERMLIFFTFYIKTVYYRKRKVVHKMSRYFLSYSSLSVSVCNVHHYHWNI